MKLLLAGAGGHAKAICEALRASALSLAGYVDPTPADWLDEPRFASDQEALDADGSGHFGSDDLERDAPLVLQVIR